VRGVTTAWFWLVVALTFPPIYLFALVVFAVTAPFDPHRRVLTSVVNALFHQYLRACWPLWRVRVSGRERLPQGPCVLIANHQSMADILALMGLRTPFKFVSKASLFSIPFIGWMMRRMRHVSIERGRLPSTKEMLVRCEALLKAGEPVLIFPEGTYASGPQRLRFKRGAFTLAQTCQVPLVPVVVQGTGALVFEDGPTFSVTSDVRVTVMPPMPPPAPGESDEAFARTLERHYAEWLNQPFPPHP
jgi:1-acyl-sn-glycerol-3-phosphate acyltransferase